MYRDFKLLPHLPKVLQTTDIFVDIIAAIAEYIDKNQKI